MFGCVSKTPPLPVKKKLSYEFTKFYKIFYNFINCPVFIDIKQIYKQIKSERDFFLCIVALCLFPTTLFERFFSFGRQKKWLLVVLGRWSSYAVTIIWEFACVDPVVVLQKWSFEQV